jgi:hypothetical protein
MDNHENSERHPPTNLRKFFVTVHQEAAKFGYSVAEVGCDIDEPFKTSEFLAQARQALV